MKTSHSFRSHFSNILGRRLGQLSLMLVSLFLLADGMPFLHAETSYQYKSAPGDYIGLGQSDRYNPQNATLSVSGDASYLTFSVSTDTEFWSVVLAAPIGEELHPGTYYNAERAAFRTGRSPGLDVYGDGRGCNQIWGSFAINQIETDTSGNVTLLDATFSQSCESATAPLLQGIVKYKMRPLSFSFVSDPGDYIGGGLSKSYFGATSLFSLTGSNTYLQYSVSGLRDSWLALISPPTGQTLKVGTYDTMRFADSMHAGLDFFGDGRGCNTSTGTLEISGITLDGSGKPTSLSATFEQHCEDATPALHGMINYYH